MTPAAISGRSSVASTTPPRRSRLIPILIVLLLAGVVAAYLLAPTIGCLILGGDLPQHEKFNRGDLVIAALSTGSDGTSPSPPPEFQVLIDGERARSLASQALGWWLPPGLTRTGQHAEGTILLSDLRERPFTWQVLVGGISPAPLACLQVLAADLNRFLSLNAQSTIEISDHQAITCTYVVDGGRIEDDDAPNHPRLERRSRVVAHGSIIVDAGSLHRVLPVRSLSGHAITTFTESPAGLHIAIEVAIEAADADVLSFPLVGDLRPLLLKQLEIAANRGLKQGLEKVILPTWFPTDLHLEVRILENGAGTPAPRLPGEPL
jgi:hypothetical protein